MSYFLKAKLIFLSMPIINISNVMNLTGKDAYIFSFFKIHINQIRIKTASVSRKINFM